MYAATHRFLGDSVAIKLLHDTARMDEFRAEAERTRAIAHPAVVRVIDFGRDEASGQCFLVMERVDGETLSARLARGPLTEAEVRRIGAALADGMQAAHDRGIVHRDLKPANVILRDDAPTIVDFGIAKALGEQSAAQTQRRVGTPPYMAPEQLVSGMISPSVDIWALGAVLFEAATGRRPFDGHDEGRCPQLVETAPRARSFSPISPALDDLLARCLEREPGRRPPSMSAIARSLRGLATEEDIEGVAERHTEDLGPVVTGVPFDNSSASASSTRRSRRPLLIGAAFALAVAAALGLFAATRGRDSVPSRTPSASTQPPSPVIAPPSSASESPPPTPITPAPATTTHPPRHSSARPHAAKEPKREPPPPPPPPPPHREGLD